MRERWDQCRGLNRGSLNEHGEEGWNEEIKYCEEEVVDEDELSNEDADESHSEKVRGKIESNDPDLVKLENGPPDYLPDDNNW